ncbi:MAG: hypothetical protein U0Q55_23230 [Vicinamibacterales bacterium]
MPIVVTRDDEQRRVTVMVSDPWSVEEVAVVSERQVTAGTWRYGTLYDLRGSTWVPSEPDMLWLVQRGQQLAARNGARGPVAVLIDADAPAQVAQRYAQHGRRRSEESVQIFRVEAEALQWLSAQPVAG